LHGQAVSGGIAIGRAHLVSHATLEVAPLPAASSATSPRAGAPSTRRWPPPAQLDVLRSEASVPGRTGRVAAFVDLHSMILADPTARRGVRELIRERRCNAEWALVQQMELVVEQFDEIEDAYLRERKQDIVQVVERVLKALQGKARKIRRRKANAARMTIVVATTCRRPTPSSSRTCASAASSPTSAAPPRIPPSSRAAWRFRRWSACTTRAADPGRRPADRRWHARRADRRSRRAHAARSTACARRELELERSKLKRLIGAVAARSTARSRSCTPTSSCRRTSIRPARSAPTASACSAPNSCS
jgi:hypothetical protein